LYEEYNACVAQNPAAMPPDLNNIVKMEAQEIDDIAFDAFYTDDMGPILAPLDVSLITHQDSNTICSTKGAGCVQPQ